MATDEAAQSSAPKGDAPTADDAPIAENVPAADDPITDDPDTRTWYLGNFIIYICSLCFGPSLEMYIYFLFLFIFSEQYLLALRLMGL